jgi:adenylate cyclase
MAAVGRLVVILSARVVDDEGGADAGVTRDQLGALRQKLIETKIAQRNGRILKANEEGLLVEFVDPTEAVRCAVEVQLDVSNRHPHSTGDQRIAFRIGVHMGELMASGDDLVIRAVAALPIAELATLIKPQSGVHGDIVNIAELVAMSAEAGGICISGPVRDAIGQEFPYDFEDVGTCGRDTHAARCAAIE